jgi:pyruvate ferredoxin oxidoreductase delta subunit
MADKKPEDYVVPLKTIDDLPPMARTMGQMFVNETGSWRNVYPKINHDECIKCGICWQFCPDLAIVENAEGFPEVDLVYCKGCGVCVEECPKSCITMLEEGK